MNNNITELVYILDRSGSMAGLESDTVGGFNAMMEKQKLVDGECYVSAILFNSVSEVLYDRVRLAQIEKMTEKEYRVGGCTALIDALGGAIRHISNIHKYARPEDVPEHTMFVVMTDGLENSSHIYTSGEVKKMVEEKKKENGWEFLFVGANIDSVETAKRYGIDGDRAVNYHADREGTKVVYDTLAEVACNLRANAPLSAGWSENINKDYLKRKKNK